MGNAGPAPKPRPVSTAVQRDAERVKRASKTFMHQETGHMSWKAPSAALPTREEYERQLAEKMRQTNEALLKDVREDSRETASSR